MSSTQSDDDLFGLDERDTGVSAELLRREAERVADQAHSGVLRSFAARWFAPLAVVAGIALAGQSIFGLDSGFGTQTVSSASVGGLRAVFSGTSPHQMPAELIVYGETQYQNFITGIARFTDTDLLAYAATTARDMRDFEHPMTPFMLDVLLLTHLEISRRGLQVPLATTSMATTSFDGQRERYRARLTNL